MPAGTSKGSTRSTRTKIRPKVYPVAGFVTFNWQRSALPNSNAVSRSNEDRIYLTQTDTERLNKAQLIGNRRGFVVALVCPRCGSVVQTYRGNDLPDGVLAKCPMQDCAKEWLNAD